MSYKSIATDNGTRVRPVGKPRTDSFVYRRQVCSPYGVDLGGSMTKFVYFRPNNPPGLPDYVIKDVEVPSDLPLKLDPSLVVDKLSNSPLFKDAFIDGKEEAGVLKFIKVPANRTEDFIQFVSETGLHLQWGLSTGGMNITGGGAYKWAEVLEAKLKCKVNQLDEMKMLIRGLNWLLANAPKEVFKCNWETKEQVFEPKLPLEDYFPYMLVNIGSGVSILKVSGPGQYERVSGSCLGGGTFWGLIRLLTNIKDFTEIKRLSQEGDNKNVDLIVGDIYGMDYKTLGLKAEWIASSFGKIATSHAEPTAGDYNNSDIIRSLLFMISNNIGQIAYLNADRLGIKRIFFAGGLIRAGSYLWSRFSYAINFWSKGKIEALYLLHDGYLGAIGSLITRPDKSKDIAKATEQPAS